MKKKERSESNLQITAKWQIQGGMGTGAPFSLEQKNFFIVVVVHVDMYI